MGKVWVPTEDRGNQKNQKNKYLRSFASIRGQILTIITSPPAPLHHGYGKAHNHHPPDVHR